MKKKERRQIVRKFRRALNKADCGLCCTAWEMMGDDAAACTPFEQVRDGKPRGG
jgi:hypothetical protein